MKTLKSDWLNKDPMTRPTSLWADNITVNVVIHLGAKIDICASFGHRQEPMIYRLWLTGLFRRVYVHPCRRASLKSLSSGRRCVHLVIWGRSACFGSNQWNIICQLRINFICAGITSWGCWRGAFRERAQQPNSTKILSGSVCQSEGGRGKEGEETEYGHNAWKTVNV